MADQTPSPTAAEDAALQEALAAAHTAVWGYGVVGAATPADGRAPVIDAEEAHRDLRDTVAALLTSRRVEPVPAEAGYALPAPVRTATDAAGLAVTLEDGTSKAWTWVLDQACDVPSSRVTARPAASAAVRTGAGSA